MNIIWNIHLWLAYGVTLLPWSSIWCTILNTVYVYVNTQKLSKTKLLFWVVCVFVTMYWNKLKILKVAKWRKDEWRMMKDECWMMKDDDFKLLWGFADWLTDEQTFVNVESLSRLKMYNLEYVKSERIVPWCGHQSRTWSHIAQYSTWYNQKQQIILNKMWKPMESFCF